MDKHTTTAQGKIDGRRLRGEVSRKQILLAAVECIATHGLGRLTLDRVAEQAGVSRGLVVFHFKSKDWLIGEVLDFLGEEYARDWQIEADRPAGSSLEKLLQLVDYDVRFCYRHPLYLSAWHAFWGESRGNVLYHNRSLPNDDRYGEEMERLLAAMIEEGGQDPGELELIASGLYTMLYGIWTETHLEQDFSYLDTYLKSLRFYLARCFPGHVVPLDLPPS